MSYRIADVELTAPLPSIRLGAGQRGLALLLRMRGRPVHFSLHSLPAGSELDGDGLWRLVGRRAGAALLAGAIRDELAPPPAPAATPITVAVCTRARPALLEACLRSVLALRDAGVDLLVVDNAPPDDATRVLVQGLAGVRYAREPRPGLDFARNRALRDAGAPWVAFLDDDVVVDRGWAGGLREALAEHPDAGAVTGLVLPNELESDAQVLFELRGGFRRGTRKLRYAGPRHPGNPLYPVGAGIFGAGCNMAVRRDLALGLGGFDEALDTGPPLPGGGDLDMFQRIVRSGAALAYEPAMLVFHRHRPEHAALRRQYHSWGEGFMAYLAKTYAADPEQRPKLRAMGAWWASATTRWVARTALRRDPAPPDLALAELRGGIVGSAGGYARSRRRSERVRRAHG